MKVNITSQENNPLLKRRELTLSIEHTQIGGTPTRTEVSKQIASLLKTNPQLVYVKNLETKTGTMVAIGEANVYDSLEQAKLIEPKHIIARNKLPEKPKSQESDKTEESEAE
jgi:small subunit ribosomal protein S24e